MAKINIISVRVTLADGTEHVWEGDGTLTVVRTLVLDHHDRKQPAARVEVVMPVPSEFGEGGSTVTPSISVA